VENTTKSNNFSNLGQLFFQSNIAGDFRMAFTFLRVVFLQHFRVNNLLTD